MKVCISYFLLAGANYLSKSSLRIGRVYFWLTALRGESIMLGKHGKSRKHVTHCLISREEVESKNSKLGQALKPQATLPVVYFLQ